MMPKTAATVDDTPGKENKNTKTRQHVLARIGEHNQDSQCMQDRAYTPYCADNDVPPQPSHRSIKRRGSILDIIEDQKIEAAPQAFIYGGDFFMVPETDKAGRLTPANITSDYDEEEGGNSFLFDVLMSGWFFKNNDLDKDVGENCPPTNSDSHIEEIGGGVLTSKVINALSMNPTSKTEGGKMNTWMPASF